jgi:hypothetical protein
MWDIIIQRILVGTLSALLVMKHGGRILTKIPYVQKEKAV